MTQDSFKVGDVVTLKSGGPDMTIDWIEKGEARCTWFADTEVKGSVFKLAQLRKPKPSEESE